MYLVQKAKNTPNKQGLPDNWPVKANPCAEHAMSPAGWEKLTDEQLDSLKSENQEAYDAWKENKEAERKQEEKQEKASKEGYCRSAQEKLKSLQFNDHEIEKIMGSNFCE